MKRKSSKIRVILYAVYSVILLHLFYSNAWASPAVSTDKHTYDQGDQIRVHFSGAPGLEGDWICIVPSEQPDTAAGDYRYLPTMTSQGTLTFFAPGPGHYEVRAYYNYRRIGYVVSARHAFTITQNWSSEKPRYHRELSHGDSRLYTERDTYTRGERIRVHFSGAPGLEGDWICIVSAGSPDTTAGIYQYIPRGDRTGHVIFRAPRPGYYEVRAYYNYRRDGYVVSARHAFTVVNK